MRKANLAFVLSVLSVILLLSGARSAGAGGPDARGELFRKAQRLIEAGAMAEARKVLEGATGELTRDATFCNLMGVVEAADGNYRKAEARFRCAIAGAPDSAGPYLNLGRLYQEHEKEEPAASDKALKTYEDLLRRQPGNIEAAYQCAVLYHRRGDFRRSAESLDRLPATYRRRPQALALLCAAHAALGQAAAAQQTADRLVAHPGLTEADLQELFPALEAARLDSVQLRLIEGLASRQDLSESLLRRLASLYERGRQPERARATLEKAAALAPDSVELLLDLARVAREQGDREGTLGYLAHARDLQPENAGVHFFFGMVCVEMNLGSEAYESLLKAVNLKPDDAYYNYAMGGVALERRDPSEAIPYFQKFRTLRPEDPRGMLALGAAYFHGGALDSARNEIDKAAGYKETAAGAHYFRGRILKQEQRFAEAANAFRSSIEAAPGYADAHAELGFAQLRARDFDAAEASLRRALELDADNYLANFYLLTLYHRTKDDRGPQQAERFEQVKQRRAERAEAFLRKIEVRP